MAEALKPQMSMEAFLAWEEGRDQRHEFDGRGPVAMTVETYARGRVPSKLALPEIGVTPPLGEIYHGIGREVAGRAVGQ
jgi:hypothetical protein